jgi:large subunit ribosomal protein L34e
MPAGREKSRRLRRVFVKTSGKLKMHYRERKPSKAVCGRCGKALSGVPRERPADLRKMAKTERRPERVYGGVLCSGCTRRELINKARREQ